MWPGRTRPERERPGADRRDRHHAYDSAPRKAMVCGSPGSAQIGAGVGLDCVT
jgi:hypothetical protein